MSIFNFIYAQSTADGAVRGIYFDENGQAKGMTFPSSSICIRGPAIEEI